MSKNDTNRVSRQLTDARERGEIPWEWVVDETREPECYRGVPSRENRPSGKSILVPWLK
jgi:hypothetical protein